MEIQIANDICIITPLSLKLDKRETERLKREVSNYSSMQVGFDLSYVNDCTIEFLEFLKDVKTGLFNVSSDIFSLLTLMNLDKSINLYTTEEDFVRNKNRLLNRKFSVV